MASDDDTQPADVVMNVGPATQPFQAGGIVGAITTQMLGAADPVVVARRVAQRQRAARRAEFLSRLHVIQQVAITVAVIAVCVFAVITLPALYWLVWSGQAWR